MHEDIEYLIKMAFADGVVTEKERAIILKKAQSLGEDTDEVEMLIENNINSLIKKENKIEKNSNILNIKKIWIHQFTKI